MDLEEALKVEKNTINNYNQTVNAIIAFAAYVVHDGKSQRPNSKFGIGRRMTTSQNNYISKSQDITPDLVAQKSEEYGVVVEVKKSITQNSSSWGEHVDQLRKYDDYLIGWWTADEKINQSDAVMLIHQSRGTELKDYITKCKKNDPKSVGQNTCIVEFNESVEVTVFYFFRLGYGEIHDSELMGGLHNGREIPLEKVKQTFSNIQYYDSEPPITLVLSRLWGDYLSSKRDEGEYDEKTRSTKIKINVDEVTDVLQKGYGSQALYRDSRSGEFPKKNWIRKAFEKMVEYKLASRETNDGEYIVYFKTIKDDLVKRFLNFELKKSKVTKAADKPNQLTLFNE